MVSEFLCTCHGTLRVEGWESRKFLETGVNKEGYWKSTDMIRQLKEDAIPLFEKFHPNCTALFIFDQSSNHQAFGESALVASRMNLNDRKVKGEEAYTFNDTVFIKDDIQHSQSLYYQKQVEIYNARKNTTVVHNEKWLKGLLKHIMIRKNVLLHNVLQTHPQLFYMNAGIKSILEERDFWFDHTLDTPTKKWKLYCGTSLPSCSKSFCCARHFLENQPDFKAQTNAIQEAIEEVTPTNEGHIFEMYAKFSPETNFIERYWSAAKRIARVSCNYTLDSLRKNLPKFLDQAGDLCQLQRYYNRCMRYVEAYSENLDGFQADDRVKKFSAAKSSHRRTL